MERRVTVALVGTGWAGSMHAASYAMLRGETPYLKWVCSLESDLPDFAARYGFAQYTKDFQQVLDDPEVDVVDIVTPPALHAGMVSAALAAKKHVICEKPLTGCFQGGETPKAEMLRQVRCELDALERELAVSGKVFCYAENWIYSPPFQRMVQLALEKGSHLLDIEGFTGHKGSHAEHAGRWKANGGGSLIRQGSHPLSAALYLKRRELEARGGSFGVRSVLCDTARLTETVPESCRGALSARAGDVEDWAQVVLTFSDGTRARITAGDMFIGQIYNQMRVFGSDCVFSCNMTPNDLLRLYFSDDRGVEGAHIMEKNDSNQGWQDALVQEEILRGYAGQLQDFMAAVRTGSQPESDFRLAKATLLVLYAAYLSAETGAAVKMDKEKEISI